MRRPRELCDGNHAVVGRCRGAGAARRPRRCAAVAICLAVSMTGLLACGENDVRPSTDADGSMSDDVRPVPDAQLEAPGGPTSTCTSGLCTSDACRDAEHHDLAQGCRFYA